MIIQIGTEVDESRILWKHKESDEWERADIDDLIRAYEDRPKGEWVDREHCQVDEDAYDVAICSNCEAEITLEYPNDNYCPNCGAMMGGDTE